MMVHKKALVIFTKALINCYKTDNFLVSSKIVVGV